MDQKAEHNTWCQDFFGAPSLRVWMMNHNYRREDKGNPVAVDQVHQLVGERLPNSAPHSVW